MTKNLNWPEMTWEKFQMLSLYLAQETYKNLKLEEYLKQGNKQDGIDLISTIIVNGYTAIQCKKEKKITASGLDKIKNEFLEGRFYDKTKLFILATTADLQTEELRLRVEEHKKELAELQVTYEVWDRNYLGKELRKYYTLVYSFFSKHEADQYCLLPGSRSIDFKDLGENYIPRNVFAFNGDDSGSYWRWDARQQNLTTITEIFKANRLNANRVCLIGDPYQGKSYLLKQTAYELSQLEHSYRPVLIELKSYVIKPIADILETEIGTWKDTPAMDLVIILDGLDEVVGDRFNDAVRYIYEFTKSYPNVSLIFSCRKLFFNQYNVSNALPGFKILDLYGLTENAVIKFLERRIPGSDKQFLVKVRQLNLLELLLSPFYLSEFIQSYIVNFEIPGSRLKALDQFIKRSIERSSERQISAGTLFKQREREYIVSTHKLAFALQLMGLNAISEENIQVLLTTVERDLLKHSSIVTIINNNWSFTSALFQEFLAARVLYELETDLVIDLITVGETIKKIKSKWLQTFSTLIELTAHGSEREKALLSVLSADNIELIFKTERSKYTESFRLTVLKNFTKKYRAINIRPIIVREYEIGAFIGADQACIDLLIKQLDSGNSAFHFKIACGNVILNCELSQKSKEKLFKVALKQFQTTRYLFFATTCVEILDYCAIYKNEIVDELISKPEFNLSHDYRSAVYRYITHAGETNRCYNYGIDGVPVLIEHNRNISHTLSETSLLEFFLTDVNYTNLKRYYSLISSDEWNRFIDHHSIFKKEIYLSRLSARTVDIYVDHPEIIFAVIDHIITVNRNGLQEEYFELDQIFEKTGSRRILIGLLFKKILGNEGWLYGGFLSEDSIPYLMFEYEEGGYNPSSLWSSVIVLEKLSHKKVVAKELNAIASVLRDLEPVNEDRRIWEEEQKFRLKVEKNDLAYIQSIDVFTSAVKKIFKGSGKEHLKEDELYVEFTDRSKLRRQVASDFLYSFLRMLVSKNSVSLKSCLAFLSKEENYRYFRAQELVRYDLSDNPTQNKVLMKEILISYFLEHVNKLSFENTYVDKSSGNVQYRIKEVLIGDIYKKLQPILPGNILMKLIWLDNGDLRELFHGSSQSDNSISKLIISNLSDTEKLLFRQQVLTNMKNGILCRGVFGTHISVCVYLNIKEAIPIILDRITELKNGKDFWILSRYSDAYVKLGGDKKELRVFLDYKKYEGSYLFFNIANHLKDSHPYWVESAFLSILRDEKVPQEDRQAASLKLIDLGSKDGFRFVIDLIRANGISPTDSPDHYSVSKIDTAFALKEMEKVRSLILNVGDDNNEKFWRSARRLLVEWIYQLSAKSEDDLKRVLDFLKQAEKDFDKHERCSDFSFYAENCKEKFKETGRYPEDIRKILSLTERVASCRIG